MSVRGRERERERERERDGERERKKERKSERERERRKKIATPTLSNIKVPSMPPESLQKQGKESSIC